jgi:hypothetical protein
VSTSGTSSGPGSAPDASSAKQTFTAPDCPGCTFPALNAPACAAGTPAINIVYPLDTVLVPPNMNVISVQWTPFGAGFTEFEVDFANSITDTRVITKCSTQTMDTGTPPMASGGCELIIDPTTWAFMSRANRGGDPVTITVRGTTNGTCANSSASSVHLSFASDDVLGAIYYWKSTVSPNGTGGQIWVSRFGDFGEVQVTGTGNGALSGSCNGCHSLSRDGARMVIYSDDNDSDDEYSDVLGSLIDMTTFNAIGGTGGGRVPGMQPPGFSTLSPNHAYYVSTDGRATMPTNIFTVWNGNAGGQVGTATFGAAGDRPTHPDWSPDGKSVIYVLPKAVALWNGSTQSGLSDDDHEFGGSLYTLPYNGNGQFGTPSVFLTSQGENNFYPSYSPDGSFVVFDRVPLDMTTVSTLTGCVTTPHPACPNDSFSNPASRMLVTPTTAGSALIDLALANGSPAAAPQPFSNSWPRWSPFLQHYKGNTLLWIAYSSTRDYGIRVRNHKTGMYQCYPADSYEQPGAAHHQPFDSFCQQPQLWMAAINLTTAATGADPSRVAFWLPFQDITTHNHTPQWTQTIAAQNTPPPDAGSSSGMPSSSGGTTCTPVGGNCLTNPAACCTSVCGANGLCQMAPP